MNQKLKELENYIKSNFNWHIENSPAHGVVPRILKKIGEINEAQVGKFTEMLPQDGLTKREYFAAMAMQGCIAMQAHPESGGHGDAGDLALKAVGYADALIAKLNKEAQVSDVPVKGKELYHDCFFSNTDQNTMTINCPDEDSEMSIIITDNGRKCVYTMTLWEAKQLKNFIQDYTHITT